MPPAPSPSSDENLQSFPLLPPRSPRLDFNLNGANLLNAEEITVGAFAPPGREIKFTTSIKF